MDIVTSDWFCFFITGLATLFLIGEILVNMRGIFGILGVVLITLYFYMFSDPNSFIIMLIIYFVGLLLIIVDGKLINDGTLATLGLASMLIAVAIAAPNLYAGLYAVIGVLLGGGSSFFLLKVFKRRNMWGKIALKDRLTKEAGYSSMNQDYEALVGKEGITLNVLRPVGTIRLEDNDYSAISNSQWIPKGTRVRVTEVDGTRILVEEVKN